MRELPIVKDLSKCMTAEHITSVVMNKIKSEFIDHLRGRATSDMVELCLDPNDETNRRYSIEIYIRVCDIWTYSDHQRDEQTGDMYNVTNGLKLEINWPCYGAMNAAMANEVLMFYTKVSNSCELLVEQYKDLQFVSLWETRADEEKREQVAKLKLNERNVISFITPHVKGMRVGPNVRIRIIENVSIDEGDYVVTIDKKVYACSVKGLEIIFVRTA
jgi:hypothetical protein